MSEDTIILQLCFCRTKLSYIGTSSLSLLNMLPAERRAAPGRATAPSTRLAGYREQVGIYFGEHGVHCSPELCEPEGNPFWQDWLTLNKLIKYRCKNQNAIFLFYREACLANKILSFCRSVQSFSIPWYVSLAGNYTKVGRLLRGPGIYWWMSVAQSDERVGCPWEEGPCWPCRP